MFQYHCLNPIAEKGLGLFDEEYKKSEDLQECDAVLVRSAKMHDMELPESVKVIARAGAGVNNIPLDRCAEEGIVVFNTPGANANGVKELVMQYPGIRSGAERFLSKHVRRKALRPTPVSEPLRRGPGSLNRMWKGSRMQPLKIPER